jgi:hypothetical protein
MSGAGAPRHAITTGGIGDGDLREAGTRSDDSKALLTVLLLALTLTEVQQATAFTPSQRRDVIANTGTGDGLPACLLAISPCP